MSEQTLKIDEKRVPWGLKGVGCEPLKENLRFCHLDLRCYQPEATRPWGTQVAKIPEFAKKSEKLTSKEQGLSYAKRA